MSKLKENLASEAVAQMNAENWPIAKQKLQKALSKFPNDYGFLQLMGIVQIRLKEPEVAYKYFQRALNLAPDDLDALKSIGEVSLILGNYREAYNHFYKTVTIKPKFAEGWYGLGKCCAKMNYFEKAIEAYERSYKFNPDSLNTVTDYLSLLEQTNKNDQLAKVVAEVSLAAPNHPVVALFRGISKFKQKKYEESKAVLESIPFDAFKVESHKSFGPSLFRYLGRSCDALHLSEQALDYFQRAKQVNNAAQTGNSDGSNKYTDFLKGRLEFLETAPKLELNRTNSSKEQPIFLIGFPRSGTTLLDTFLRGHKDLDVLEETQTVARMKAALGVHSKSDLSALADISDDQIEAARKAYWETVNTFKPSGRVVDKMPLNIASIVEIMSVFPKAKFIFAMRDPADVLLSCIMQVFDRNIAMAALDTPNETAHTYDLVMKIWERTVTVYQPDFIINRYEDLVDDPAPALRKLVDFLELEWDESLLDHQKTALGRGKIGTPSYDQVAQPIYNTSVARWERYADLIPEELKILAPWRKHFGYCD